MSSASSIISTLGAGSGVDWATLAADLSTAQFALRSERLTEKSEVLERQISSASYLKNMLSTFSTSLGDRVRTGDLASAPSVTNGAVATASSPVGTIGKGSYSLEVTALAKRQTLTAPAYTAATDPVGSGTLTLRFGTTSTTGFAENATRPAIAITIASGATLADVAGAINGANSGVTAYVAQTTNGAQLVLKGAEGANSGFILEATETVGEEGLANLAWDPRAAGDPARLLAQSGDAAFLLDGLPMTSASNTTGQIAPGLQLVMTGTNTGNPTTINFSQPTANITSAMTDIVAALNEIMTELNTATDPKGGDLSRDPGARALKRAFTQLGGTVVMPNADADAPRTMSDLGLVIQRDGTFTLDTTRLHATLERDPAGVAAMFTTGLYGVYSTIDKLARNAGRTGDPGTLGGSITRYQTQSTKVAEDVAELLEKQETLRAQMVARFARTDSRVGESKSTLSFLQGQIDAWNSSND